MPKDNLEKALQRSVDNTYINEIEHTEHLLKFLKLSPSQYAKIKNDALSLVKVLKLTKSKSTESFMHQYSLSNDEGIAIMCLAESLLRIPDKKTAQELVADKLKSKDWNKHIGQSDSLFVNASTWGLLLTGKIINLAESKFSFSKLVNKLGEPVILSSIKQAIKMISEEFIMGHDIPSALKNGKSCMDKGFRLSFDILGESSRTQDQADYYYSEYLKAIKSFSTLKSSGDLYDQTNLSVKLSALHPKVLLKKSKRLHKELMPKLIELTKLAKEANITLSFDAEESYRQDIYLDLLSELILHKDFADYPGIGFVVQAYQKRSFYTIDYISEIAKASGKKIPVRLVKGAYWDTEIKHAQELGLKDYTVFTKKEHTDTSYLACAQKMLKYADCIYAQFATHNAHTIASIIEMAGIIKFEFQKLHGMGGAIHEEAIRRGKKCRIYAPVGQYKELLAYLMRRLLENGANTSFVNLAANKDITNEELIANPIEKTKRNLDVPSSIPQPSDIYGISRKNSEGYEIGLKIDYDTLHKSVKKFSKTTHYAKSLLSNKKLKSNNESIEVISPTAKNIIGTYIKASDAQILAALDNAHNFNNEWQNIDVTNRAKIINKFSDLLHENRFELYSILISEAGKNIEDAISEVREAIDFARFYSSEAIRLCSHPIKLPGYTGESNTLSLNPRGTFLCISPWNFPLAIFAGQILAALVTGNTVVAKAAENTTLIAHYAINLMHKAGVPDAALQFVIAGGRKINELLIPDHRIKGVVFTGSTSTARTINMTLASREDSIIPFIAETGGQNAMIVDSSALLEQATDNIIQSSFGSIGQRCSALRVAYIQKEIYQPLTTMLIGAMNDLKIGDTYDFSTDFGPVINDSAKHELQDHVNKMAGNVLAIHPSHKEKLLVKGSFFAPHIIELKSISQLEQENFGPILHVIPFESTNLEKVMDEITATNFGLTFGLQTRIEEKIHYVASKMKVGNFYANRSTIGAVVGTQPFGGENNSGTGFKAGGPHYLLKFMTERVLTINTTAIGGNVELLRK